jgi:Ni,Fe-hydrogenase III large subunit/Ni,Fe-hydrogenase III component G
MDFAPLGLTPETLPGAVPVRRARTSVELMMKACGAVREAGGVMVALWGSDDRDRGQGYTLHVALQDEEGLLVLGVTLPEAAPEFPDLSRMFAPARRMQRAVFDLLGLRARSAPPVPGRPERRLGADPRLWLRHAAWPEDVHPLRRDFDAAQKFPVAQERYPFVKVEGDGVHEIPVGPVHAGVIEPGHFRFSVVGEKVLRLEERLGYAHKGIEKRFESLPLLEGQRLAARVSGDSAVAFSWAYCMALEGIAGLTPPPRALAMRALMLERERIANHLGDLGALGNDAGFAFGLSQFMRLKEDLLRANAGALGARYLNDAVVPGGVAGDLAEDARRRLLEQIPALKREIAVLREIYDNHAGMQDRFMACGIVTPAVAARLGLTGMAGRASSQSWDLRCDHPHAPYDRLEVRMATHLGGDVAARVEVRFDEVLESLRLCRVLLETLPDGEIRAAVPAMSDGRLGIGWVEGWRGPVLIALESGAGGAIRRCHAHDPSWQNWQLLEHAVIGNIVPDFPLINKSFNLSYSGHDL